MRVRRLIVAACITLATVGVTAGAAHAAPANKFTKECIDKLEAGAEVDECQEAPSVLKPGNSELVWGSISFAILLVLFFKWGYPAVVKAMKAREDRIRGDLEGAEGAKSEAETVLAEYRAQLAEARSEAGRIIDEASQAADQVRRDLIARAEADAADLRARAQDDIRIAGERAMADLRGRVSDLSIELAEKIVERNLDRDTQMALIDNYINSVGSNWQMASAERIEAYAQAIYEIASAEGFLADTEEELFRFARTFESNDELRTKLSDRSIPVAVRQGVIEDLFSHRALESTAAIVSLLVGSGRVSDLPEIVDRFVAIAAANRAHEIAEVRSAVPLDAAQQARLATALSQATGKQVEVKVIVDENVLGGIVARIGDTVIDGTVRRRLAQLKERI